MFMDTVYTSLYTNTLELFVYAEIVVIHPTWKDQDAQ